MRNRNVAVVSGYALNRPRFTRRGIAFTLCNIEYVTTSRGVKLVAVRVEARASDPAVVAGLVTLTRGDAVTVRGPLATLLVNVGEVGPHRAKRIPFIKVREFRLHPDDNVGAQFLDERLSST